LAGNEGKDQRLRQAAMSPEVAVPDTKPKANHVKIRNNRAQDASHPDTLGDLGSIETGSYAEGRDRV